MVPPRLRYGRAGGQHISFQESRRRRRSDGIETACTLTGPGGPWLSAVGESNWYRAPRDQASRLRASARNKSERQFRGMSNSTDQPPDVYVAVDMAYIGFGYNLRTRSDSYHLLCTIVAAGGLAWVPVIIFTTMTVLTVLGWLLHTVVLLAPMSCWSVVLGALHRDSRGCRSSSLAVLSLTRYASCGLT